MTIAPTNPNHRASPDPRSSPLKSKSQMRWMFANHPAMAKRWTKHTEDTKNLPEKVAADLNMLATSAMAQQLTPGKTQKSEVDRPLISEKSASQHLDLDWLEASDARLEGSASTKTNTSTLVEAVKRVKLASTLTEVLKTEFAHRTPNVSADGDTSSYLSGLIEKVPGLTERVIEMGSGLTVRPSKTASCDESLTLSLATCDPIDFTKQAIQIPAGWQPRPMIDIQKMLLKPHPLFTTPLGASIKAHDATQAEIAAKAKPGDQAGSGTSVGPGNSPNIHPITAYPGFESL